MANALAAPKSMPARPPGMTSLWPRLPRGEVRRCGGWRLPFIFFSFFFSSQQELGLSDCFRPSSDVPLAHAVLTFQVSAGIGLSREVSVQLAATRQPLAYPVPVDGLCHPQRMRSCVSSACPGPWSVHVTAPAASLVHCCLPVTRSSAWHTPAA